ncbi:hypothetical protein NX059_004731 [Plenodomus lindquistii]|nr:hypothetical protein NX059_004731 [Plenodomus lindquistii]
MKVDLKFEGVTDQGLFDCVNIIDAVDQNARKYRLSPVKKTMGLQYMDVVVGCQSKEVTGGCPNEECKYQLDKCFK